MKAVISNGGFKFHLAPAAAELNRLGALALFITAGYPTPRVKSWAAKLGASTALDRLIDRAEDLPQDLVHPLWLPELLLQSGRRAGAALGRAGLTATAELLALRRYAASATHVMKSAAADIYHYRSGYGGASVEVARQRGMLAVCDHSIADPRLLAHFVQHAGRWPDSPASLRTDSGLSAGERAFWTFVLDDMLRADHVVVNSAFVKRSMVFMGFDPARVHVIPLGVDAQFMRHVVPRRPGGEVAAHRPMRLVFAGGLLPRKGFDVLVDALRTIDGDAWSLDIAGGADQATLRRYRSFFDDHRVRYLGTLSRRDLAERMSTADVFVFPSLAEGSARVVFEAMAAGCFVITTENSGSIVEHGVHGKLVEPGSATDTARKIREALAAPHAVAAIGQTNQGLVMSRYRQEDYGRSLVALYAQLNSRT